MTAYVVVTVRVRMIVVVAVRMDVMPVSFLDFKAAVFAPNENAENNTHGTDLSINSRDGALVALRSSLAAGTRTLEACGPSTFSFT